jgi:hypothetical protein
MLDAIAIPLATLAAVGVFFSGLGFAFAQKRSTATLGLVGLATNLALFCWWVFVGVR